jgi:hypothetical protein
MPTPIGVNYAEIDPNRMRGPEWNLDVASHYARPDAFRLTVNQEGRPIIAVAEAEALED